VLNKQFDLRSESGQWWALYYGGIKTLTMTKDDMAARAEFLRTHAFEIAGLAVPPHAVPPAPVITYKGLDVIAWRGSTFAVKYTIERQASASAPWVVVSDSATDADTPFVDLAAGFSIPTYRVTAYNADGIASQPSAPR
jgi:mannan endo-1,4-beta-mannosidase